jgi:putative ABC transport system substrate-binding protein
MLSAEPMAVPRRAVLAGALALALTPRAACAQPAGGTAIAFVSERDLPPKYLEALRGGLSERGWVEGRDFRIESRSAQGDLERLPGIIAELVGRGVSLIVTGIGSPVALSAKRATSKIPIVFVTGGDPVEVGIVSSAAKPGGNVTGCGAGPGVVRQRLELLREVNPAVKRVGFVANLTNPIHPRLFRAAEQAGRSLGVTLHEVGVFEASELADAFSRVRDARVDALFVPGDAMFSRHRAGLVTLVEGTRLPAVYGDRLFPENGGLMSLAVDLVALCRCAAGHVDRILRGAQAGSLPVTEARAFEVVVNPGAARAIGLTLPPSLLKRAQKAG